MMRAVNDKNDLTGKMPEVGRLTMFQTQAMKIESWNSTGFTKFIITGVKRISALSNY